ncbi:PA14 domain-containing protein [Streptomyces fagopyri]|uniref:PA14 domain-containing protein n=1 Tax=Streptomyces fagopyri TaxID=2662397 RepID=UPI003828726F
MSSARTSRLTAATTAVVALTGGLVASATSQASAASCSTNSYTRQFFANTSFSGAAKRTDCDSAIGENWGKSSPGVSGVGIDNFAVRWQVTRDFGSGGPFAFNASGQDGIRVYLDGVRTIDLWKNGSTTVSRTVNLIIPKGTHTLRIDYVNWNGAAAVNFTYTPRTGTSLDQVAPLTPAGLAIARDADAKRNVLHWSANKELDVAGYRVYRRTSDQASFGSPIATVTGTTFTDTTAGTINHLYEIRAVDKSGNTSPGTADVSVTGNPTFLRQYYANTTFTGTPAHTDTDASITENWGNKSPGVSGVGIDNFAVRWQVTRDFGSGGPFAFNASGQDGIRVYLDGVRKIDLWKNGSTTVSRTATFTMPPGTHVLRVDYVNWNGAAAVNFAYTPAPSGPDHVAPLPPAGTKVVYDEAAETATLTWEPNKEMDLPAYPYQVYWQVGNSGWIPTGQTNKTTWSAPKIPHDGIPRQYAVQATDRVGNQSQLSAIQTITPQDTITPPAPDLVVAHKVGTSTSLMLSWLGPAATAEEIRTGGSLRIYRSTSSTLGDTPEPIATVTAASATIDSFTDELPAYDGTTYTYAAQVTDAAGNMSPMSKPVTVTPDSVPPPALTGLTATPRADGIVLSWDAPEENGLHYVAARVVRRADGSIHYDNSGCLDAADWAAPPRDVPNALLCAGPLDGQTVTFFVAALDPWDNHIPWAAASTVTITEPDNRPAEAHNPDSGPLTITSSENTGNLGTVQWRCDDVALCSSIAEYHVDAWNPSTNTYNRVKTVAGSKGPLYASYMPLNRADTTYFRITGVRVDGSTAAVAHGAQTYGYSL